MVRNINIYMKHIIQKYIQASKDELEKRNKKIAYSLLSFASIFLIFSILTTTLLPSFAVSSLLKADLSQNQNEDNENGDYTEEVNYLFARFDETDIYYNEFADTYSGQNMKDVFDEEIPEAYGANVGIYLEGKFPGLSGIL